MSGRRKSVGPTSCQSCRIKKLRCNKTQPCSNCAVRQIACQFSIKQPNPLRSVDVENDLALMDRVERLEATLYQVPTISIDPINSKSDTVSEDLRILDTGSLRAMSAEVSKSIQHEDVRLLETLGTRNDATLSNFSHKLSFRKQSIDMLVQRAAPVDSELDNHFISLPLYNEAVVLLQAYEATVNHVCSILHMPTIRSFMAAWYLALDEGQSVAKGQAALLLAVFALTTFFYHPPLLDQLLKSESESTCVSRIFIKAALDVLDHCRRISSGSLEEVQAYTLVATVVFYTDGFSARGRALISTAITTARDLRLHQLDAIDTYATDKCAVQFDTVSLELKRRVFWYLASTDWLQSTTSGPQEGTYYFQPRQISVALPKDLMGNEVYGDNNGQILIESNPDGVRFLLERIRLADICRRIADILPTTFPLLSKLSYDQIMKLDRDLLEFLSTLPYFFKADTESREQARQLESSYPMLGLLRCLITLTAHSRRCKLHQKFLLLQKIDPCYAFSKSACLDSARRIVLSFKDLVADGCSWHSVARMGMPVHHLHLAIAVFITDICCSGDAADAADVRAELWDVLHMLEGLKFKSSWLPQSLISLRTVLNKYQIYFADDPQFYVSKPTTRTDGETQPDELSSFGSEYFDPSVMMTAEALSYTNEWEGLLENIDLQYL